MFSLVWWVFQKCQPNQQQHVYKPRGVKGIVHFEIKMWYLSAYPKGIQDVGVFFSSVDPIIQGCVQPRQNGAKRLLNGNGDALNTLF